MAPMPLTMSCLPGTGSQLPAPSSLVPKPHPGFHSHLCPVIMVYSAPGRAWAGEGQGWLACPVQQVIGRGSSHLLKFACITWVTSYPSKDNILQQIKNTMTIWDRDHKRKSFFSYFLNKEPTFHFALGPRNYIASPHYQYDLMQSM